VNSRSPARLLTIGEFSAATQLSAKALRLYDDQQLLPPAKIDATNGYRYYGSGQVARGRLIRTLRAMDLPLVDIAAVVRAEGGGAQRLLVEFARQQDYRYASERRAFKSALLLLQGSTPASTPRIVEQTRPAVTVISREFSASRRSFIERFRTVRCSVDSTLAAVGAAASGMAWCRMLDPLTDDEGRLEVVVPVAVAPGVIPCQELAAQTCAVLDIDVLHVHATDFTAALDTLFDWFDRRGYRAVDVPLVAFDERGAQLQTQIRWAFDAAPNL
jgi:DNA-binding transcriptional MerR regulator